MLAQIFFVPIGGALSSIDPWIPMAISTAMTISAFLCALVYLPETLTPSKRTVGAEDTVGLLPSPSSDTVPHSHGLKYLPIQSELLKYARWGTGNWRLVLVLMCFFPYSIGQQFSGSLPLQYASKRLDTSLSGVSDLVFLHFVSQIIIRELTRGVSRAHSSLHLVLPSISLITPLVFLFSRACC